MLLVSDKENRLAAHWDRVTSNRIYGAIFESAVSREG